MSYTDPFKNKLASSVRESLSRRQRLSLSGF